MSKSLKFLAFFLASTVLTNATNAEGGRYGLGREALPEEIKAWDIDVRPDGVGVPRGRGKASDGEVIYAEQCAVCHGDFGEGVDRWPVLVGGEDTLASDDPVKTVGSYWPYVSTIFDYIRRAMPFGNAQSLTANDVYALTAYLLYMNEVVEDEDFVLSDKNFATVRLPNEKNFIGDARPDTLLITEREPCMKNCKATVEIVGRARVLDVTPDDPDKGRASAQQ
ncbi:MAG: c-type cytochrome [Hyphomicrobiaceae bacterium]